MRKIAPWLSTIGLCLAILLPGMVLINCVRPPLKIVAIRELPYCENRIIAVQTSLPCQFQVRMCNGTMCVATDIEPEVGTLHLFILPKVATHTEITAYTTDNHTTNFDLEAEIDRF